MHGRKQESEESIDFFATVRCIKNELEISFSSKYHFQPTAVSTVRYQETTSQFYLITQ
jgi:hypothetical protein